MTLSAGKLRIASPLAGGLVIAVSLLSAARVPAPSSDPRAGPAHPAIPLIERGVIEMRTDPEASRRDAEAALQALQQHPDPDLEIQARLILCDYQAERDTAAAEHEINVATALLPRARRTGLAAGLLNCRGQILETAGDNTKARAAYEQAVNVASATHDDDMLAESLFLRGYLLGLQGEYAAGLADLKRSQSLYDRLNKPLHSLTTLNSIAILYNRMGDYAQAQHIYSRALAAQREAGMQREEAVTLHNLGRAYENLHDWEGARRSFNEAFTLCRQLNYPRGEAYALRGLAAVANGTGDPQGALKILKQADELRQQTPDARLRAQIQLARGIAFHKLQRLPDSIQALEDALQIFQQAGAIGELNASYAELAEVYAASGNWRAAYERRSQAEEISERLLNNQLDQRFATLRVEFDTAAKERENAALMRENRVNEQALAQGLRVRRLQAAVIALSVILVSLLGLLALYQRRSTLRMRKLALTDELTGAPNRRCVLAKLEPLLQDAQAPPCSILIVDIDHFKKINDQNGHPAGDEVLKLVAAEVRCSVPAAAFFGRLGGEEFLIVLPETSLGQAREVAEQFRQRLMRLDISRWCAERPQVTASIGCTVSIPGSDSTSAMLKRADIALYSAKRAGRNCVQTEPVSEPGPHALVMEAP